MDDNLVLNLVNGAEPTKAFKVEYAQNGKAICVMCRYRIDRCGELRVGMRFPGKYHDGLEMRWVHGSCFFRRPRGLKGEKDLEGIEEMEEDDRRWIKGKIEAHREKPFDFRARYAPGKKPECFECKEVIPQGSLEIGKTVYFGSERILLYLGYKGIERWHHPECFQKIRMECRFLQAGDCEENMPGFEELRPDDQERLEKLLPEINPSPLKRKLEEDSEDKEDLEEPKVRKEPETAPEAVSNLKGDGDKESKGYKWYYQGRKQGWWQYDPISMTKLEAKFLRGSNTCQLFIQGTSYIVNFPWMYQQRMDGLGDKRKIKRELGGWGEGEVKGVAGVLTVNQASNQNEETDLKTDEEDEEEK